MGLARCRRACLLLQRTHACRSTSRVRRSTPSLPKRLTRVACPSIWCSTVCPTIRKMILRLVVVGTCAGTHTRTTHDDAGGALQPRPPVSYPLPCPTFCTLERACFFRTLSRVCALSEAPFGIHCSLQLQIHCSLRNANKYVITQALIS